LTRGAVTIEDKKLIDCYPIGCIVRSPDRVTDRPPPGKYASNTFAVNEQLINK
jgi:hypothetical protein